MNSMLRGRFISGGNLFVAGGSLLLDSTIRITAVRMSSSLRQTLQPWPGPILLALSLLVVPLIQFLSCFASACWKADDLSLAHTEASLLPWPGSSFLQAGPGHRCVLMRASLCLQGLGCADRQLHPFTLRRLEGPKYGGSEWQQL